MYLGEMEGERIVAIGRWQKRPIPVAKEAYTSGKNGLHQRQKRPILVATNNLFLGSVSKFGVSVTKQSYYNHFAI